MGVKSTPEFDNVVTLVYVQVAHTPADKPLNISSSRFWNGSIHFAARNSSIGFTGDVNRELLLAVVLLIHIASSMDKNKCQ